MKAAIMRQYHADTALASLVRRSYRTLVGPGVDRLRQRQLERRTVRELREVSEILTLNGCVWSLQSGNVLGIYRDGGYLKNEEDIDLAVLAETWTIKIEEDIRQKGFDVSMFCGGYNENSEGVHITLQKQGMIFDLYPAFKGTWDGVPYRWYGGDHENRYYFAPELLEETRSVDFYGITVELPKDTDRYLRAIYGDDYMVPNPDWDWQTQPKCRLGLSPTYLSQADVDTYLSHWLQVKLIGKLSNL